MRRPVDLEVQAPSKTNVFHPQGRFPHTVRANAEAAISLQATAEGPASAFLGNRAATPASSSQHRDRHLPDTQKHNPRRK